MDTELMAKIDKLRKSGETYQSIGKKCGVSAALIWKVANGRCTSHKARYYFGLSPSRVMIKPCSCGEVHTRKTCPHATRRKKRYRVALEFETKEEQQEMIKILSSGGSSRIRQSTELLNFLR